MSTDFWIQASCPRWTMKASSDDETVCEAIQTIFPLATEVAVLVWRHIYIPLSYKYCISFLVDDIVAMVDQLTSSENGQLEVQWPSNDFAAVWQLQWSGGHLRIVSDWRSVVGGTEELLRQRSELHVSLQEFLCEWTKILTTVSDALAAAGYTQESLPGLARITAAAFKIGGAGKLYS